jgi:hypothetical protein
MACARRRAYGIALEVLASLSIACGPRYVANGQPEPAPALDDDDASASSSTPEHTADPQAGCRIDPECGLPEDPQIFAVCEAGTCERWDTVQMWSWATSVAPELSSLREAGALANVPWIPASGTLRVFVDARQLIWPNKARCVPIDLEWAEGALVGEIPEVLGTKPGTKNAWFYTLRLHDGVDVLGPGRVTSSADGDGAEAIGGLQSFGLHLRATDDALRYTGTHFATEVACGSARIERTGCEPVVCEGCSELALRKRPLDRGVATGSVAGTITRSGGACEPCPADTFGPLLPRLDAAVTGRIFIDDAGDDAGPVFHRRVQTCTVELKQRSRRLARARRPL